MRMFIPKLCFISHHSCWIHIWLYSSWPHSSSWDLVVSVLMKRQVIEQSHVASNLFCGKDMKICSSTCSIEQSQESHSTECHGSSQESVDTHPDISPHATGVSAREDRQNETKKKARKKQGSQLSLKSFFKRNADSQIDVDKSARRPSPDSTHADVQTADPLEREDCTMMTKPENSSSDGCAIDTGFCSSAEKERNNIALMEWQRIQQVMQSSIPLCKEHNEPCVSRVVKKAGPNFGRRFYTCPRAEVFLFHKKWVLMNDSLF